MTDTPNSKRTAACTGRNRLSGLLILLTAALLLFASFCFAEGEEAPIRFLVNGTEPVSLWEAPDGRNAYLFLPSCAETGRTVLQVPEGVTASIGGTALKTGMSCAAFAPGQSYPMTLRGREMTLTILQSANTAALFVRTAPEEISKMLADKEYEAPAAVTLMTADGQMNYSSDEGDTISGRGNSTWKLEKKPFDLKLGKKTELLRMSAAKKWSLLANAYDETNLRNRLILDFARETAPYEGFSPECEFADLYLNGEYQGLYLMCQSTKDTASRILDTESPDTYEIELTMTNKLREGDEFLPLVQGISAEIKYPDPLTDAQRGQLTALLSDIQRLVRAEGTVASDIRIDTESWARKILIEAIFENYDAPNASQFFWGNLSDKTVFAGPCWDYDLSMGIYYINWSTPYAIMAFKDWNRGMDISWYHGIWEKPEIRQRAVGIYRDEMRGMLTALLDTRVPALAAQTAKAVSLDRARWPGLYGRHEGFLEAVDSMVSYMRERLAFLDSMWLKQDKYHQITMKLPNTRMLHLYVRAGESCPYLPLPCEVSLPGEGMEDAKVWFHEDTGVPFDPSAPVTGDLVLYAVLPDSPS